MDQERIKKYILFTLEYPPTRGGIARYYGSLAKFWPSEGFFVLADKTSDQADGPTIEYRRLINQNLRPRWLPSLWHLYKTVAKSSPPAPRPEILVGQILPLGLAAYILSKFIKLEYSVILHGLDFSLALKKRQVTKKILSRARRIICANTHTANSVKAFDYTLAPKTSVVNPGIELSFVRDPARVKELRRRHGLDGKTVIFSLGRLVRRKGFDTVIEAMPQITAAAPETCYVIGGTGPEDEALRAKAASLPEEVRKKIIFLGELSDQDQWAWLELCDIFIMASKDIGGDFEGFGIVYLEANLAGKPVIAGDSGGVRDAVIDGVNGLLADPEDATAIAASAIKLIQDENLRIELGRQGQRRVVENFTAKKMAEKFHNQLAGQ